MSSGEGRVKGGYVRTQSQTERVQAEHWAMDPVGLRPGVERVGRRPQEAVQGLMGREGGLGVGEPPGVETFGSQAFVGSLENK